jgi:hypothetical protein
MAPPVREDELIWQKQQETMEPEFEPKTTSWLPNSPNRYSLVCWTLVFGPSYFYMNQKTTEFIWRLTHARRSGLSPWSSSLAAARSPRYIEADSRPVRPFRFVDSLDHVWRSRSNTRRSRQHLHCSCFHPLLCWTGWIFWIPSDDQRTMFHLVIILPPRCGRLHQSTNHKISTHMNYQNNMSPSQVAMINKASK